MKTELEIKTFASLVESDQRTRYISDYGNGHPDLVTGACATHFHMGRKFARVDVGSSGRYMVDLETGEIYGIKAYGVVHKGHRFGTIDTIQDWDWGGYRAHQRQSQLTNAAIN